MRVRLVRRSEPDESGALMDFLDIGEFRSRYFVLLTPWLLLPRFLSLLERLFIAPASRLDRSSLTLALCISLGRFYSSSRRPNTIGQGPGTDKGRSRRLELMH
jgi:hypothetical protein